MARLVVWVLVVSFPGIGNVLAGDDKADQTAQSTKVTPAEIFDATYQSPLPKTFVSDTRQRQREAVTRLVQMAKHYDSLGLHVLAIDELIKAQTAIHRSHGVNSLVQLPILDQLTALYITNRQFDDADQVEAFRLELLSKHFQKGHDVMINASFRIAKWHMFRGRHVEAVFALEEGLEVIDDLLSILDTNILRQQKLKFERTADQASLMMFRDWDQEIDS